MGTGILSSVGLEITLDNREAESDGRTAVASRSSQPKRSTVDGGRRRRDDMDKEGGGER